MVVVICFCMRLCVLLLALALTLRLVLTIDGLQVTQSQNMVVATLQIPILGSIRHRALHIGSLLLYVEKAAVFEHAAIAEIAREPVVQCPQVRDEALSAFVVSSFAHCAAQNH